SVHSSRTPLALPSFPTRRSSDLTGFWYWTVTVSFAGLTQTWSFFLPSSPSTTDLYSTANTPAGGAGSGFTNPMTAVGDLIDGGTDRKSTRLNSSHDQISYAVFCL